MPKYRERRKIVDVRRFHYVTRTISHDTTETRHSPAERELPASSFNFLTWPISDGRYFRCVTAAGCSLGGAENRFGNTAGSATSLKLGRPALISLVYANFPFPIIVPHTPFIPRVITLVALSDDILRDFLAARFFQCVSKKRLCSDNHVVSRLSFATPELRGAARSIDTRLVISKRKAGSAAPISPFSMGDHLNSTLDISHRGRKPSRVPRTLDELDKGALRHS